MKTTIKVKGMGCQGCVSSVTKALKGVPGVTKVEVSLDKAIAVVESASAAVTKEQLITAVENEGYKAEVVTA